MCWIFKEDFASRFRSLVTILDPILFAFAVFEDITIDRVGTGSCKAYRRYNVDKRKREGWAGGGLRTALRCVAPQQTSVNRQIQISHHHFLTKETARRRKTLHVSLIIRSNDLAGMRCYESCLNAVYLL